MAEDNTHPGDQAKFNMGLAILQRINDLLRIYHSVSIFNSIESGGGQKIMLPDKFEAHKVRVGICKQLLVASYPLLKDDQKETLEAEMKNISVQKEEHRDSHGRLVKVRLLYSPAMDDRCDEFILNLEATLQDNKVFMPGKGESSLF